MGRHKKYSRQTIVRKAMEVFWRHGYDGTSTQMLVDGMGVNRFSVYAEFGSKQALYEAALALYEQEVVERNLAVIEAPGAGLDAIVQLLRGFAAWAAEDSSALGCFMCNTATECAPNDLGSQRLVHRYVERLSAAFGACLQEAGRQQQLLPHVDPVQEGQFLATLLLGFFVQLRARVPAQRIAMSAQGAAGHLQRLTCAQSWQPRLKG